MLSHHHRTIFVHVPKCAGQSVETAFLTDLGLTWETRAPLLLRPNDRPELGPPRLAHLTAIEYVQRHYVTQEMFDGYFKFAVVRDPWSRTVSLYRHLGLNMPFRTFVLDWLPQQFADRSWSGSYWFVRPQTEFLFDAGRLLMDEVVRFETLDADFERIARSCGPSQPLPHVNRSAGRASGKAASPLKRLKASFRPDRRDRHENWTAFFDDATTKGVAELYGEDAKAFGYRPPDGAGPGARP